MKSPMLPAATLLLLLAGCGGPHAAAEQAPTQPSVVEGESPAPVGAGGITAIDAALADGAAMPADSAAPSAYDRAMRAGVQADRPARRISPASAPRRLEAGGEDQLLQADESVAAGG